jgi:hypothetical protein
VFCTICLTTRKDNQEWFLMVENRWTDRLKVLSWHDELASDPACHAACCVAHVQQLVIHWMTTGTLDYPFARTQACPDTATTPHVVHLSDLKEEPDISGAELLGELAVHRESIDRILVESASSLGAILSALKDALPERVDHSEMAEQETPECDAFALSEA